MKADLLVYCDLLDMTEDEVLELSELQITDDLIFSYSVEAGISGEEAFAAIQVLQRNARNFLQAVDVISEQVANPLFVCGIKEGRITGNRQIWK